MNTPQPNITIIDENLSLQTAIINLILGTYSIYLDNFESVLIMNPLCPNIVIKPVELDIPKEYLTPTYRHLKHTKNLDIVSIETSIYDFVCFLLNPLDNIYHEEKIIESNKVRYDIISLSLCELLLFDGVDLKQESWKIVSLQNIEPANVAGFGKPTYSTDPDFLIKQFMQEISTNPTPTDTKPDTPPDNNLKS
jgi:hypothetical protein